MLSNILKELRNRRSVREYLPKDVSYNIILKVLEASIWAPSAHNAQPWRFIVISDLRIKQRLAETMSREWDKDLRESGFSVEDREHLTKTSIKKFTQPPIILLACLTMEDMDIYPDERRCKAEYLMAVHSVAASIQNMLLAAHFEGLGTCWYCAPLFCQAKVRKILGIPDDIEPQALVTLGYSDEKPEAPPRKPLKTIMYQNHWGCSG
jgi:coenzyme F420-0:L-glutamate ligase/coenzyme F420-1:gamma-L-glutamate ligase